METLVLRLTTSSPAPIVPLELTTLTLPVSRNSWSPGVNTARSPVATWSLVSSLTVPVATKLSISLVPPSP
ncbi:hypothetical protein D3C78_1724150 [compost metagenome]